MSHLGKTVIPFAFTAGIGGFTLAVSTGITDVVADFVIIVIAIAIAVGLFYIMRGLALRLSSGSDSQKLKG